MVFSDVGLDLKWSGREVHSMTVVLARKGSHCNNLSFTSSQCRSEMAKLAPVVTLSEINVRPQSLEGMSPLLIGA
jgi:hypothetical protein